MVSAGELAWGGAIVFVLLIDKRIKVGARSVALAGALWAVLVELFACTNIAEVVVAAVVLAVCIWYLWDDWDDRRKKLKRRLGQMVKNIGHRLVIAPIPVPVRA